MVYSRKITPLEGQPEVRPEFVYQEDEITCGQYQMLFGMRMEFTLPLHKYNFDI